jgi:hypothetical protein
MKFMLMRSEANFIGVVRNYFNAICDPFRITIKPPFLVVVFDFYSVNDLEGNL